MMQQQVMQQQVMQQQVMQQPKAQHHPTPLAPSQAFSPVRLAPPPEPTPGDADSPPNQGQ